MEKRLDKLRKNSLLAHGGGHGTASGVAFQASLGAWLASHMLCEKHLPERLNGRQVLSLRFETEAPVDDILVETAGGWIYIEAKSSVNLSAKPGGVLAGIAKQLVRLWMACSAGNGDRGWNRPLRWERDRILIAVGTHAPKTVVRDLERGLGVLRSSDSAPLSIRSERAIGIFQGLLGNAWESVAGRPATETEIASITRLVTIRAFDFAGADGEVAEAMLEQVLGIRGQASAAFRAMAEHCQGLMSERSGSNLGGLQHALSAKGVRLTAAPSLQQDTERLREYSNRVHGQLSEHESIVIRGDRVAIKRKCKDVVVDAALDGSLLLVGEPGAGKSAVLNASADRLRDEGRDVLILAVDRLPVLSLEGLRTELGLEHPLRDVLVGWPGNKPGYLFIDALDATRGGQSEAVFRALIAEVLSLKGGRWRVVASIRSFDLRMGVQFKQLFAGQPVSTDFHDSAFGDVRHVHVPTWTDDELNRLLRDAPALLIAINAGGRTAAGCCARTVQYASDGRSSRERRGRGARSTTSIAKSSY